MAQPDHEGGHSEHRVEQAHTLVDSLFSLDLAEATPALDALNALCRQREQEIDVQNILEAPRLEHVTSMCAAGRRIAGGNNENVVAWHDKLVRGARSLLIHVGETRETTPLNKIETKARDAAAMIYVLFHSPVTDEKIREQKRILSSSAVDTNRLLDTLKAATVNTLDNGSDKSVTRARIDAEVKDFKDIRFELHGLSKRHIYRHHIAAIIEELEGAGVALPVLGEDGLYDSER